MHRGKALRQVVSSLVVVFALASASLYSGKPAIAAFEPEQCGPEARAFLDELNIKDDQIRSTTFVEGRGSGEAAGSVVENYQYWLRLKSCSGYLYIEFNSACIRNQAYTRGNCAVDGVPSF